MHKPIKKLLLHSHHWKKRQLNKENPSNYALFNAPLNAIADT
jgi:hypothetical protein